MVLATGVARVLVKKNIPRFTTELISVASKRTVCQVQGAKELYGANCNSHGLPHREFNDPNHVSLIDLVFTTVTPLEHHNQAELTWCFV